MIKRLFAVLVMFIVVVKVDANVVVTVTFDGTLDEHFTMSQLLSNNGLKGTFFINSLKINRNDHLTTGKLDNMLKAGHEFGGNTKTNKDLTKLTVAETYQEICVDRSFLIHHGYNVTSFSYPLGKNSLVIQEIVKECGYNMAKSYSQFEQLDQFIPETTSPEHLYDIQSYSWKSQNNLKDIQDLIIFDTTVNTTSGVKDTWIIINFNRMCVDDCDPKYSFNIDQTTFTQFVLWLAAEHNSHAITVLPMQDVIDAVYRPVPEEFNLEPPPFVIDNPYPFDLNMVIGLCIAGAFVLLIIVYVCYTGCKRARKAKITLRKVNTALLA